MGIRATRWFLIAAPVVAGILVLLLGTAGTISITFGIVLIGIGPMAWLWNWLIRMSFEDDQGREPGTDQHGGEPQPPPQAHRQRAPHDPRGKLTGAPRRRP